MNDNNAPDPEDRIVALWGIAASKQVKSEHCPGAEELAAFIDNRLHGAHRKSMLNHLNRCSSCYHHWLEIASHLDTKAIKAKRHSRLDRSWIPRALTTLSDQWKIAISIVAGIVVIGFLMLPITLDETQLEPNPIAINTQIDETQLEPNPIAVNTQIDETQLEPKPIAVNTQIDEIYEAAIRIDGAQLTSIVREFPLSWQKEIGQRAFSSNFAFVPEYVTSSRAFAAGIWAGRNHLLQTDAVTFPESLLPTSGSNWQESEWWDYHEFGRWAVLVWASTQSQQALTEWDAFLQILRKLRAELSKRPSDEAQAQEALAALNRIEPLLASASNGKNPKAYTTLSWTLLSIMEVLALPLL
ncbi:MAG: hypothetical protein GY792_08225 [Gammaproteobacteria bacterium]|nr:hypothetical protein [Gammaproteobacteria bacterium]